MQWGLEGWRTWDLKGWRRGFEGQHFFIFNLEISTLLMQGGGKNIEENNKKKVLPLETLAPPLEVRALPL